MSRAASGAPVTRMLFPSHAAAALLSAPSRLGRSLLPTVAASATGPPSQPPPPNTPVTVPPSAHAYATRPWAHQAPNHVHGPVIRGVPTTSPCQLRTTLSASCSTLPSPTTPDLKRYIILLATMVV